MTEFRDYWHIPGGYNRVGDRLKLYDGAVTFDMALDIGEAFGIETISPVVSRVAQREIGVDVEIRGIADLFWWQQSPNRAEFAHGDHHPYGWPLSLYILCEPLEPIEERWNRKFFDVRTLPSPMVEPHRQFILKHFPY